MFSILIPSWNNLDCLRLCVESLQKNSAHEHELILHLNEGSDGSREWAECSGLKFSHSAENVGVCHAVNAAAAQASREILVYFNDDMVALPGWDTALLGAMEGLDHGLWSLSSTMVEPRGEGNPCVLAPHDFGRNPASFQMEALLQDFQDWPLVDWCGATWPPNAFPRELFEAVGGFSVEFSPGMSSDPDFSMKLWQHGVRHFQGVAASRVYHFQAQSTGRVVKNDGPRQFREKWGIGQGAFGKYYLRRGQPWTGPQAEPGAGATIARMATRLRGLFS